MFAGDRGRAIRNICTAYCGGWQTMRKLSTGPTGLFLDTDIESFYEHRM
jgi:hypothetical protein